MKQAEHQARLVRLPQLFQQLMQAPIHPLRRGFLPDAEALYIFYIDGEPVSIGSAAHIDQAGLLWPSVRLGLRLRPGRTDVTDAPPSLANRLSVEARWLKLADAEDRKLLEVFAAQSLGLSITHPELKAALKSLVPAPA